ncbi:transmembrane protein 141 [Malaya genurostris]|uniref:transmembrane protein 141 n=1 Tax=Malaya genurostris TaxID=325434 RepID=UPI0026F3DEB4|nr:transmembrane protein 141 [Malaya genurostris]XP_058449611.1 transmembrane protein 141 [Malaya genurostris]
MNDIRRLKEQQRDKHPGFGSYLECMTRSLFTGLASFTIGFSATYFLQKLLAHKLPYQPKTAILISSLIATGASYKVTTDRTKSCQAGWMAAEGKYTALSEEENEDSI